MIPLRSSIFLCLASCASQPGSNPPTNDGVAQAVTPPVVDPAPSSTSKPVDAEAPPATYTNPVLPQDFPDPFVLRADDAYFAFSTNVGARNVPVARSTDLANWNDLPDALPVLPNWAAKNASLTWAPSVLRRGAAYVLYYTARSKAIGFQCIGRAVATRPEGPYTDDSSEPFICQDTLCGSIDASPFVASNGDAYILWKSDENASACAGNARLWSQRLGIDGLSLLDTPIELLKRDRNWEAPLVEGPSMVQIDDSYYLFYSANWWESPDYGIGYAICATPHGPCSKKTLDGPIVKSGQGALGPGGQEMFTDGSGRLWMAYHAWSDPIVGYSNGGARSLRIDPLSFTGGVPALAGPTTSARAL